MSSETTNVHTDEVGHPAEHETMTKKKIVNVFFILLGITALEFFVALVLVPRHLIWQPIVNPFYILLTLLKAFFIVAYFMHLKFEKIGFAMAIILPILFIIGLILVLTNESHYWIDLRKTLLG